MGNWLKYYAEEGTSEDQIKAIQVLLPLIFEYDFEPNVLLAETADIQIERNDTMTIYSVDDSYTKVVMLKGLDGGPIKMENLPFDYTREYIQYKTIKSNHTSETESFEHAETHAFVGRVCASGDSDGKHEKGQCDSQKDE